MKKIIYLFLFLILPFAGSVSAQTGVRFGVKGGYSLATQYGIDVPDIPYTVDSKYRHAFAGGIIAYFPITKSFGLQQELLYVMKGSRQDITIDSPPTSTFTHTEYDLNYMEIPIVFRYTFVKLGNFKIYGSTGFALSIMLNGKSRLDGIVDLSGNKVPFTYSTKLEGVDTFDYGFIYGAGTEFNLLHKNAFLEYRFNIGWNTLNLPTFAGQDPAPLRNQDYIFALGFYL
jgi:hypothetical protein